MVRVLWVGSICINQSNIKERNHQVGVMDKIYKNASTVHICIQDPDRDYSQCLRRLNGQEHCSRKSIDQTAELFRRRYFQRVWVIQEVLLARSAILLVNDDSAEITKTNTVSIQEMCKRNEIVVLALLADPEVLQAAKDGTLSITQCLNISMNSSSSDPRDKVFGVLGMLDPSVRTCIPVDYSMTLTQVYQRVATACVVDTGDLSMLCCAHIPSESDLLTTSVFGHAEFLYYRQSAFIEGQPQKLWRWSCWTIRVALQSNHGDNDRHNTQEKARNLSWDRIREYTLYHISSIVSRDALRNFRWRNIGCELESAVEILSDVQPTDQLLPGVRVRAHFIDHVLGSTRSTPEDLANKTFVENQNFTSVDYQWMHSLRFREARTPVSWMEHFMNMEKFGKTISSSEDQKSFYTRYTIGSSPSDFRPGDKIFALDGVPCPLLLRRARPNQYRIVGKCYILFGEHLRICNAPEVVREVEDPWDWFSQMPRTQCNRTRMIKVY
jgi:hypothetical protein